MLRVSAVSSEDNDLPPFEKMLAHPKQVINLTLDEDSNGNDDDITEVS